MSPARFVVPEKGMQDVAKSGKIPDRQIQSGNAWSCFVKKRFPDYAGYERGLDGMNYKYNTTNELNHFDFAEAVIGDIQMTDGMFRAVIDNVKILPENNCNRDIRTMRTNELMLKLDNAEIACLILEGYREYDADGNLKNTYADVTVPPEQYKEKEEVLIEGTIYELKLADAVYSFVIDGTDERTYTLKVTASGDEESWNRFLEL